MNNYQRVTAFITEYIKEHPEYTTRLLSRQEVIELYQIKYHDLKGSDVSPTDICWNRCNGYRMTKDFQNWPHCLEYHDGDFKVLGEDVKYTGEVYWKPIGEKEEHIFGVWIEGVFHKGMQAIPNVAD